MHQNCQIASNVHYTMSVYFNPERSTSSIAIGIQGFDTYKSDLNESFRNSDSHHRLHGADRRFVPVFSTF